MTTAKNKSSAGQKRRNFYFAAQHGGYTEPIPHQLSDKRNVVLTEFKDGQFAVTFADSVDNLSF